MEVEEDPRLVHKPPKYLDVHTDLQSWDCVEKIHAGSDVLVWSEDGMIVAGSCCGDEFNYKVAFTLCGKPSTPPCTTIHCSSPAQSQHMRSRSSSCEKCVEGGYVTPTPSPRWLYQVYPLCLLSAHGIRRLQGPTSQYRLWEQPHACQIS